MATESEVRNVLAKVQDPELKKSIIDLGMVRREYAQCKMRLKKEKGGLQPGRPGIVEGDC